jgi:hypothetical protein
MYLSRGGYYALVPTSTSVIFGIAFRNHDFNDYCVYVGEGEGCANSVSCGEVVFVDEAAESVAPLDGGVWWAHGAEALFGRVG